jgi:hypothetical protein
VIQYFGAVFDGFQEGLSIFWFLICLICHLEVRFLESRKYLGGLVILIIILMFASLILNFYN